MRRENAWICGVWGAAPFLRDRIRTPPHSAMRICSFFRMRDEMGGSTGNSLTARSSQFAGIRSGSASPPALCALRKGA